MAKEQHQLQQANFLFAQLLAQAKTLEPNGQLRYNALFEGKRKQAIVKTQTNQIQAEISLIEQKIAQRNEQKNLLQQQQLKLIKKEKKLIHCYQQAKKTPSFKNRCAGTDTITGISNLWLIFLLIETNTLIAVHVI
ncbi:MAG TPA: hypothetical protein ACHBX0_04775 [Arsenophonus sp.]